MAKQLKISAVHGQPKSELSGKNGIIDCSHIISVKYAKETGRTELCWSQSNIRFLTREEHIKHDNLTNQERERIYKEWNEIETFGI